MRLWAMTVGNEVLTATVTADPGVEAIVSKNTTTGKVYVFLSCVHGRKTQNYPVLISGLGSLSIADGTSVTTYLVDDQHSNAYDAGNSNASLQTGNTTLGTRGINAVSGGNVGVNLRSRGAALVAIG